ncbi:MAG TPA: glycosyltransferase [Candidatus Angelobacter sp.]|nr:glycosyltransferase [Candidatus Angelobacter sp.]
MTADPIRVLTLIESNTVTGPSRILIEFARDAIHPQPGMPAVRVALVSYHRGSGENRLESVATQAGLQVYSIPERSRFDISVLPALRRIVDEYRPDILESRNVKSHFFVRLLGLHKRYPWIAWNHGYTATSRMDQTYNLFDRWSLRAPFRLVTVCGPFAKRLVAEGAAPGKITVLHNFVKPFQRPSADEVRSTRQALGLNNGDSVILCAGRLSKEKGHADLISAVALVARRRDLPPTRTVIVGDGPEREALDRQAAALGISERVVFAGFQKDVAPYFGVADILALPSHSEGSPNVVLEAMAAGLPIAATAVGGVPEILVNRETGLMVPAQNPEAMADAIGELLMDRELCRRLGAAARRQAESAHTLGSYQHKLVSLYQETLLASGRG